MGKNKARHILHGVLDCLPIILIPIFMIYSQNHEINDNTLQVQEKVEVEHFNQLIQNENINGNFTTNGVQWGVYNSQNINLIYGHKYVTRIDIKSSESYSMWYRLGLSSRVQYVMQLNNLNTEYQRFTYLAELVYGDTTSTSNQGYFMTPTNANGITITYENLNLFDLTQMYGEGNEPTLNEFNDLFVEESYDYTLNNTIYIDGVDITYDDTDIMSQSFYCLYNAVDKYFNMGNVFGMHNLYNWFEVNIFGGTASPSIYIVWNIVLYEFVMDLLFLLYGLFMFFIDLCKRLMEKPLNSIK